MVHEVKLLVFVVVVIVVSFGCAAVPRGRGQAFAMR